jgi:trehalose 6-phosphate phosphatase
MRDGVVGAIDLDGAALFLDVDGTILEFAASPAAAVAPEGLVSCLARVKSALGGALALVSGRTLSDLDRLFRPLRLRASGVHGAEVRFDPMASVVVAERAEAPPAGAWRRLNAILADFPGAFAENKRFSFAVHYRAAPSLAARLGDALRRFAGDQAPLDLELVEGRLAYELKARGFDKGAAIRRFMARAPFAGRVPIFVGDDATDEDGFAAVASLRGFAYSVGRSRSAVAAAFPDPASVRRWLESLVAERAPA